jgi:hypothetical protein
MALGPAAQDQTVSALCSFNFHVRISSRSSLTLKKKKEVTTYHAGDFVLSYQSVLDQ